MRFQSETYVFKFLFKFHSFQQVPFNQSQIGIERHVCCINIVLTKIFVLYSAEDKQFAVTRGLNPPPYGTAGDCYSAQGKCPQVTLYKINKQLNK